MMISRDYLSLWYFFYFKRLKKKSISDSCSFQICPQMFSWERMWFKREGLQLRPPQALSDHFRGPKTSRDTHTHTNSNVKTIRLSRSLSSPEEIVFLKKKERKETERKSTCCLQRELCIFQTETISCFIWRKVTEIITYYEILQAAKQFHFFKLVIVNN